MECGPMCKMCFTNWTKVADPIKLSQAPSAEDKATAWELGRVMAEAVLK